jgi:hypothetical protein
MPKLKKTEDFRGRLTDKANNKVNELRIVSNNPLNKECELLIVDGLAAREFLSREALENNRKKYF